jgi:hypothetical protein
LSSRWRSLKSWWSCSPASAGFIYYFFALETDEEEGYGHWLVALAMLAFLAFLLFFIFLMMPKGGVLLPGSWGAKPQRITASIEVEGRGLILANGTPLPSWDSTKPFKLRLEAMPEPCWVFRGWLVNGSFYSAEPNATLLVGGNTTVKAVFERLRYRLTFASNASWGLVSVNGSVVETPYELEAPCGSLLYLTLLAGSNETHGFTPVGFLVNGNLTGKPLELHIYGSANVTALYRVETHVLYIETNAPGAKVLVDGAETSLPARIQRPRPFTAYIQAPPLIQVNDTFAWGGAEVQELRYRWGQGYVWVTVAAGNASVTVEGEKRVRVYYYPLRKVGGAYVTWPAVFGDQRVEGNALLGGPGVYRFVLILPENWSSVKARVEGRVARFTHIVYPYRLTEAGLSVEKHAKGDAQGFCDLIAELTATRDPPAAHIRVIACDVEVALNDNFENRLEWQWGEGLKQYTGRLIIVMGFAQSVRVYVEVRG